jgi:hypothetical protein
MRKRNSKLPANSKTNAVPAFALTHGQVMWLMTELGLRGGVGGSTFNSYIKSLRRLGIPFEPVKGPSRRHRQATYDFEELMELTIALLLRVYGTVPDAVLVGLRNFRDDLRPIYRQGFHDSVTRMFPAARVVERVGRRLTVEGLFLDLNIRYAAGQIVEFGPPKAMSPFEAIAIFTRAEIPGRSYLPLNVTAVAEMIVGRAYVAPSIRRGRGARRTHVG